MTVTRRLAAILAADVTVTRDSSADEDGTLEPLKASVECGINELMREARHQNS
jgi:hypothetical protein